MKIAYNVSLDDIVAFNLYHCKNSPHMRRTCNNCAWGGAIMAIVIGALAALWVQSFWPVIVGTAFGLVFAFIFPKTYRRSIEKNVRGLYTESSQAGATGRHELEILPDGLIETAAGNQQKTAWENVGPIAKTDSHIFVYVSKMMAHVIPTAAIESGDIEEFVNQLEQRAEKSTAKTQHV